MDADLSNLIGRRIRLLHTHDAYSKLHFGSLGIIKDITVTPSIDIILWCKWDEGTELALIASRDSFEFVD